MNVSYYRAKNKPSNVLFSFTDNLPENLRHTSFYVETETPGIFKMLNVDSAKVAERVAALSLILSAKPCSEKLEQPVKEEPQEPKNEFIVTDSNLNESFKQRHSWKDASY
jgi:hypothetical protein